MNSCWLFHDGGRYHIETSPLICSANKWTGFYIITASVMKELTILSWSLFNTLMDLSYSTFVSKLFIYTDTLILRLCIMGNVTNVFGCSQLNRPWQSMNVQLHLTLPIFLSCCPVILSSWCLIDRVSTRFLVSAVYKRSHLIFTVIYVSFL